MVVEKIDENTYDEVKVICSGKRNVEMQHLQLPPGEYYILIEAYWVTKYARTFTVNNYSDVPVEFKEVLKS